MAARFVYEGHGHRAEVVLRWGGLGRTVFLFDGRELEPVRQRWFRWRVEATTRDGDRAVAWVVETLPGSYGEVQARVWRDGRLVSGWG